MGLGQKIASIRKKKSISQTFLAEHSGISLRTIQRIEKGKSTPRPYTLRAIANALDIQIEELSLEKENQTKLNGQKQHSSALSVINFSSLAGVILPFFNILIPFIFWYLNKNIPLVNNKGRKIISFQIFWSSISLFILVTTHIIHYKVTGEFVTGRLPFVFIVYLVLLSINVFLILTNSIRLKKGELNIYPHIPSLF